MKYLLSSFWTTSIIDFINNFIYIKLFNFISFTKSRFDKAFSNFKDFFVLEDFTDNRIGTDGWTHFIYRFPIIFIIVFNT